ncbi:hypothetical protein [Archangium lansingense]|uniref:Cytochrome c domain-containing protein n=1 Tax=Archangium lansingense TaxID=2995310 RepID=A0ABT4A288_9BACT|nr:hypothetical protein [Archangium lansinium]MCY1075728.1 hypothetical protein [Archangium lansinium]
MRRHVFCWSTGIRTLVVCLLALGSLGPAQRAWGGERGLRQIEERIRLPIEVLGEEGTVEVARILLPVCCPGPTRLWMQVHGLGYEGEASVQLNDSAWIPLRNDTAQVEGLGKAYGGIGGAYATLRLSVPIPNGSLRRGNNWIRFRLNQTQGMSIGYRVLDFELLGPEGEPLLDSRIFEEDDPSRWVPPRPEAIAEGAALWRTKPLLTSRLQPTPIRAHCMDCHSRDGRDLRYFNYSNRAIIEAARFHGLSRNEGEKVASYIRSLKDMPAPGRPWNPPYQPGPGLDSKPLSHWAAGAGVDAVLERDRDLFAFLFPSGITPEAVATSGYLNVRETPIPMQLPDWNHWLPTIHPMDAWGDAFYNSSLNKLYNGEGSSTVYKTHLRADFLSARSAGYTSLSRYRYDVNAWALELYKFESPRAASQPNDPVYSQKLYSLGLWQLSKMWEMMQEFELEGHAREMFPASRETRGWFDHIAFDISPNALHMPRANTGINNNTPLMYTYFSMAWYQLQLVLNSGNHHQDATTRNGQRPVDWPYVYGFLKDLMNDTGGQSPTGAWLVYWMTKAMQVHDNGLGPEFPYSAGWNTRNVGNVTLLVHPDFRRGWTETPDTERRQIMEALLSTWLAKNLQYTPQPWYDGKWARPDELLTGLPDASMGDRLKYLLPKARALGVNPVLLGRIAAWAKTLWPQENWDAL